MDNLLSWVAYIDRGTEYCGKPESHDYQLYNDIGHSYGMWLMVQYVSIDRMTSTNCG